jgi:hypothetical protein
MAKKETDIKADIRATDERGENVSMMEPMLIGDD